MTTRIALRGISKTYPMPGEDVRALRDVTLDIGAGEFVSVVGPSGSGKTTLLYLIGLLAHPTSGTYELDGRDVSRLTDRELAAVRASEIGFVFQAFHLLPQLDVEDNVLLSHRYLDHEVTNPRKAATALLERVGLSHRLGHRPRELSGGEMQRVAIARALLTEPGVVLADEPTGNLDEENGEHIFDLLRQLVDEGKTVILVTHDRALADRADRRIELRDGAVAHEARPTAA